jgi:hypothetical protein
MGRRGRRIAAIAMVPALATLAILGLVVGMADAERAQSGDLIVSLNGGITPRKLPRDHRVPVAVQLVGGISTADGAALPRVKSIKFALAYRGKLFTKGLAVCPRGRLRGADNRLAIRRCGGALVGHGKLYARVFVPTQAPFGIHARLLAFNGKTKSGRTAVWVHAFVSNPPVAFVLPFHVRRQRGPYSTILETVVPRDVGPWPRFAHFGINISRQFMYRGKPHSYLTASCPLPPHFTAGFLSFARATFSFDEAPKLSTESVRSCRARGGGQGKSGT